MLHITELIQIERIKMVSEKIIIFGMGNIFKRRIKQFDFSKIVAVTDNQILNSEEEYSALKIIRPEEIKTLEFDFVVICTGYTIAKEIYTQLTRILEISGTKIISEQRYFYKTSWEPRTLLEVCRGLRIQSITNAKKYFLSHGILSNTNVFGVDFSDISWTRGEKSKAILLNELALENEFDKYESETYEFILFFLVKVNKKILKLKL